MEGSGLRWRGAVSGGWERSLVERSDRGGGERSQVEGSDRWLRRAVSGGVEGSLEGSGLMCRGVRMVSRVRSSLIGLSSHASPMAVSS